MLGIENILHRKLSEREVQQSLRSLKLQGDLIDFCSNDYLGFSKSEFIKEKIQAEFADKKYDLGSKGSRLLAGNTALAEELERNIAHFHQAEAGLLFNSGYDANLGLLATLPQRNDTIISDELIHASIIDGIRLSYAQKLTFKHNDISSLEQKLKLATGHIFIVVESVYSMDGDEAPLVAIVALAQKYNAKLIVDEAHAVGIMGENGEGLCQKLQIQDQIWLRVVTFGKAMGCHGAMVLCNSLVKRYLINFCRTFIYTTAAPIHSLLNIKYAYECLQSSGAELKLFRSNLLLFKSLADENAIAMMDSNAAIQGIIVGGNEKTRQYARFLQEKGFDVRPILSPTVAEGWERLRICIHSFNTPDEIINLVKNLAACIQQKGIL